MQDRVAVAIPVFNGAEHVAEAIASAQAQTVDSDVLVFDNASTDDTVQVARSLLPETAVIRSTQNLGAASNFNRAVRESDGTYFAWLAHDDRIAPGFVDACRRELESHPEAPACLPGIQFTDSTGAPTRRQADPDLASSTPATRFRSFLRRRRWTETYCLYRREWLERSPLFVAEYGADVLLTWWFLLRAPLAVLAEPLYEYREYPLGSVATATEKAADSLQPGREKVHWKKVRMWRSLWSMTYDEGVPVATARAARMQLVALGTWPGILFWVVEDVLDRWPGIDRGLRRIWERVGAPGRIAPTA